MTYCRIHKSLNLLVAFLAYLFLWTTASGTVHAQSGDQRQFLLGADISALALPDIKSNSVSRHWSLPHYKENGEETDELTILKRHGWNAYRLRVFVSPVRKAPDNSLANTIPLAKKIKDAGAILVLSLHFSDTWSDPQHQEIPVAWRGKDTKALARMWQSHARDVVRALRLAGAMPDIVQIGNETTRGAAWPIAQLLEPGSTEYNPPQPYNGVEQWSNLTLLLKSGIRGVEQGAGTHRPLIAIHIDKGGTWSTTQWYFDHLVAAHVRFDIIAQSFYPPWGHGTLQELKTNMENCAERYPGKLFLVAETGYYKAVKPSEDMQWPITPDGRRQFMLDLANTVEASPNGLGILYWAPERDFWNDDGTPGPVVFIANQISR